MQDSERYRLLVETVGAFAIYLIDIEGTIATWNRGAERLSGYSSEVIGTPVSFLCLDDEQAETIYDARAGACKSRAGAAINIQIRKKDGSIITALTTLEAVRDGAGALVGYAVTMRDLSQRMEVQEAHRRTEEQFRRLVRSVVDYAIYMLDLDGHVQSWNAGAERIKGYRPDEIIGQHFSVFYTAEDRNSDEPVRGLNSAREFGRFENQAWRVRKDGSLFWAHVVIDRIDDDNGCPIGFAKVTRDATASLQAEKALDEMRKALHQSQKMEAIGQLTGGIAHDFNNLLQVISGNLDLLRSDLSGNERTERRLNNAMEGVSRGAKLASQLLSFARRQPLAPKVVNLGKLIREIDDLLRRTLGDGVEVETIIGGGLWNCCIDRANLENALLNLAINARDAMEARGRLTIEAGNACLDDQYAERHPDVKAGQYVLLAVTDTGRGIPSEILEKVFDPFFTTKPEGSGTGLGLSMVYGFVKQSGGHIKLYSEVGHGTTVRIYLPRCAEVEEKAFASSDLGVLNRGHETILVAEDDEGVRETAVSLLRNLGYHVLQAPNAEVAWQMVDSGVPLDLLFTDVVMPGPLRSPELARRVRVKFPHLPILFTSGYTANAIVHAGKLDDGVELLSKPYTHAALAKKIRELLDAARLQPIAETNGRWRSAAYSPQSKLERCILVCEDNIAIRTTIGDVLVSKGYSVAQVNSAEDALAWCASNPVDLLITDLLLSGASGSDLVSRLREIRPALPIVIITGETHQGHTSDKHTEVLLKPFGADALTDVIESLLC